MLPRYFRRVIADPRADEFDAWGACQMFFEIDENGICTRQVERYQNGFILKYDSSHQQDEYGGISDPANDLSDVWEFYISADEFEEAWRDDAINFKAPRPTAG